MVDILLASHTQLLLAGAVISPSSFGGAEAVHMHLYVRSVDREETVVH